MTPLLFVALSVAGGLGAAARLVLDGLIRQVTTRGGRPARFPAATVVINVSGSLVLGLLTGLALRGALPDAWRLIVGTGFLGGYTTFSTASFETVRLLQERRPWAGIANGLGTAILATAAAGLGLVLGALS